MQAIPGRKYAQIIDGKVHWVFTSDDLAEWDDAAFEVRDITGLDTPEEGSLAGEGNVFSPPEPEPAPETPFDRLLSALVSKKVLTSEEAAGVLTKEMKRG